jgi:hypothetical protein
MLSNTWGQGKRFWTESSLPWILPYERSFGLLMQWQNTNFIGSISYLYVVSSSYILMMRHRFILCSLLSINFQINLFAGAFKSIGIFLRTYVISSKLCHQHRNKPGSSPSVSVHRISIHLPNGALSVTKHLPPFKSYEQAFCYNFPSSCSFGWCPSLFPLLQIYIPNVTFF